MKLVVDLFALYNPAWEGVKMAVFLYRYPYHPQFSVTPWHLVLTIKLACSETPLYSVRSNDVSVIYSI